MKLDSLTGAPPFAGALPGRRSAPVQRLPVETAATASRESGRAAQQTHAAVAAAELARAAANRALAQKGSELAFEFDDELGRVIAKLIDTQTREVIRQVPSAELLAIARALAEGSRRGSLVSGDA